MGKLKNLLKGAKMCQNCEHCIYLCEGDFICDMDEPVLVMEDFEPTDDYMSCGGIDFEEQE